MINNLTKNWSEIIGKKYEKLCYPQSVKFDKSEKSASLTIGVYNPAIGFFLESNSDAIVERIAVLYGFKSIAKIIIKQDPKNIATDKTTEIKLSQAQEKNLEEKLNQVADENLAEVLRKLGKDIVTAP